MASTFEQRYDWLRVNGMMDVEAYEFADAYRLEDLRELPYFQIMLFRRRRYIRELRRLGLSDAEIIDRILNNTYYRRGWYTVWDLLRYWRDKVIGSGAEPSPGFTKKKGSHHPVGREWGKGDVAKQRKKWKQKQKTKNADLDRINDDMLRALQRGDTDTWRRLQEERNQKYGY